MMKEKNTSQVVFVRHAHRDKPIPDADNGLSEKGRGQVEDLIKDYKKGTLPQSRIFWSSPKKRCVETLGPLSHLEGVPLHIEKLLDEQGSESSQKFQKRIQELLKKVQTQKQTVYLCSHGDVIPEAIGLMTGKQVDVSKGQAVVIAHDGESWTLL